MIPEERFELIAEKMLRQTFNAPQYILFHVGNKVTGHERNWPYLFYGRLREFHNLQIVFAF